MKESMEGGGSFYVIRSCQAGFPFNDFEIKRMLSHHGGKSWSLMVMVMVLTRMLGMLGMLGMPRVASTSDAQGCDRNGPSIFGRASYRDAGLVIEHEMSHVFMGEGHYGR